MQVVLCNVTCGLYWGVSSARNLFSSLLLYNKQYACNLFVIVILRLNGMPRTTATKCITFISNYINTLANLLSILIPLISTYLNCLSLDIYFMGWELNPLSFCLIKILHKQAYLYINFSICDNVYHYEKLVSHFLLQYHLWYQ